MQPEGLFGAALCTAGSRAVFIDTYSGTAHTSVECPLLAELSMTAALNVRVFFSGLLAGSVGMG